MYHGRTKYANNHKGDYKVPITRRKARKVRAKPQVFDHPDGGVVKLWDGRNNRPAPKEPCDWRNVKRFTEELCGLVSEPASYREIYEREIDWETWLERVLAAVDCLRDAVYPLAAFGRIINGNGGKPVDTAELASL